MHITALALAQRYLGTRERPGVADEPFIRAWLQQAGFGAEAHDEIPWCGAFCGHITWLLDLPRPVGLIARARAWIRVGYPVDLEAAQPGWDIVIFSRGILPQPGPEIIDAPGHVAFFASLLGSSVGVIGGNQSDAVTFAKYDRTRVLGVRRLFDE